MKWTWVFALAACASCVLPPAETERRVVGNEEELRAALRELGPGVQVLLAAGEYRGGHYLAGVRGTVARPIVIGALDSAQPPVFAGGGVEAWHLSGCHHLVLRDLVVRGFAGNGINVDDGGDLLAPSRGIRIERVMIEATGPQGNHDALKMSGVDEFVVKDCAFRGWGGSAVDLVGCHDGVIEGCRFAGAEGFSQSSGVQIKGGSARVKVLDCQFSDAGSRAVNAGGSTGLAYFRPPDATAEAREVEIRGCTFRGGETPVAVVGAVGVRIEDNDIVLPEKWVLRILQETRGERFEPCRDGVFASNRITFDGRVRTFVNVGPGTLPETFLIQGNDWIELGEGGRVLESPRQPHWPPQ